MRVVIALGGHSLSPVHLSSDFSMQRQSAARAARHLAPVITEHQTVLTQGNGPEASLLALQSGTCSSVGELPLDVLMAAAEGSIAYVLQTEVERVFDGDILTVLTRTIVDPHDDEFEWPTMRIGPVYRDVDAAQRLADQHGWVLASDGDGVRRVVASPEPRDVVEARLIERLVAQNVLVICAGGGGVPVGDDRSWVRGAEAVIDRDLASALLAALVDADRFVSLTDVEGVIDGWDTPNPRAVEHAAPAELRRRRFDAVSIGPKVEAACRFVEATGRSAAVGSLADAAAVVAGTSGTQVDTKSGYVLAGSGSSHSVGARS